VSVMYSTEAISLVTRSLPKASHHAQCPQRSETASTSDEASLQIAGTVRVESYESRNGAKAK